MLKRLQNLFINITESLLVYDKTDEHNFRMTIGEKYVVGNDIVRFFATNGKIIVERMREQDSRVIYRKVLDGPGQYLIASHYTIKLPSVSREFKSFYNHLKFNVGTEHIKISTGTKTLDRPYVVKLHAWVNKSVHYKFMIFLKDDDIDEITSKRIIQLINRCESIDLAALMTYFMGRNKYSVIAKLDEEFFEMANYILSNTCIVNN